MLQGSILHHAEGGKGLAGSIPEPGVGKAGPSWCHSAELLWWRGADCFLSPGVKRSLVLARAVGDPRGIPSPRHPSSGMPEVVAGSLHQRVPEHCRLISWHGAWRRGARPPHPRLQRSQFEPLLFQGSQGTALFSSGLVYIPDSYCSASECIGKRARARCVCRMDQGSL